MISTTRVGAHFAATGTRVVDPFRCTTGLAQHARVGASHWSPTRAKNEQGAASIASSGAHRGSAPVTASTAPPEAAVTGLLATRDRFTSLGT